MVRANRPPAPNQAKAPIRLTFAAPVNTEPTADLEHWQDCEPRCFLVSARNLDARARRLAPMTDHRLAARSRLAVLPAFIAVVVLAVGACGSSAPSASHHASTLARAVRRATDRPRVRRGRRPRPGPAARRDHRARSRPDRAGDLLDRRRHRRRLAGDLRDRLGRLPGRLHRPPHLDLGRRGGRVDHVHRRGRLTAARGHPRGHEGGIHADRRVRPGHRRPDLPRRTARRSVMRPAPGRRRGARDPRRFRRPGSPRSRPTAQATSGSPSLPATTRSRPPPSRGS